MLNLFWIVPLFSLFLLKNPTNKTGHIISDTKTNKQQQPVYHHLHNPAYSPSAKEFTNKTEYYNKLIEQLNVSSMRYKELLLNHSSI